MTDMNNNFWHIIDRLVATSEVMIDRPRGSAHPRFPENIYPIDYGYLANTTGADGAQIDVWVGTRKRRDVDAVLCSVDALKRDSEIKILLGCSEREKRRILAFHNQSEHMAALMVRR
jgi:inorganic pyrophosphatase